MPATDMERELRPATLDDAALVADLEATRDPQDPRDPALLRYWWQMEDELGHAMRLVRVREGAAVAFVGALHDSWSDGQRRFGVIRPRLHHEEWRDDDFARLVEIGADWLRREGGEAAVVRVREDFPTELGILERLGFRENRRMRTSELDLASRRDHIIAAARDAHRRMQEQGVVMHPFSEDPDPEKYQKLFEAMIESQHDVPRSVPERNVTLEQWRRFWFDNPAIRQDRFWIARQGDDIVACSVLDCPVVRGVPWTAYTGTRRSVRGRGIARALKYQSMAQAIAVGYTRVRTSNDAENPAILHINAEIGYRFVAPMLELHAPL
jgi:GNAT superfamily N-acetyltransferase